MSTTNKNTNAAGVHPEDSKALKEREAQEHEKPIIAALKEMYSCKPTESTFAIYSEDAVFHDPIGIAKGVDSIRNQFVGLAKLFPRADIPMLRVLENPHTAQPNVLFIDQDVSYFRNPKSTSPTKTVNSLLTLELDGTTNKVVHHSEEWNHEKTTTSEDGFFGLMNEQRKKITANLVDLVDGGAKPKN